MYTDYEGGAGGGSLYCAVNLFIISHSNDYPYSAGTKDSLQEMTLKCVKKNETPLANHATHGMILDKIEVWAPSKMKKSSSDLTFKKKVQHSLAVLNAQSKMHPWVKNSPFNLYRGRPVYMAPAHLTCDELATIMLSQKVELTVPQCYFSKDKNLQSFTLEQVQ